MSYAQPPIRIIIVLLLPVLLVQLVSVARRCRMVLLGRVLVAIIVMAQLGLMAASRLRVIHVMFITITVVIVMTF